MVWGTSSLLVHVTCWPARIVRSIGLKVKLSILTLVPVAWFGVVSGAAAALTSADHRTMEVAAIVKMPQLPVPVSFLLHIVILIETLPNLLVLNPQLPAYVCRGRGLLS